MNLKFEIILMNFLLLFSPFSIYSKVVTTFPDILLPTQLEVDKENIYIVQDYSVFVYSKTDYSLKKQIGSKGEGPGEFKLHPKVVVLKNGLILESFFKFIHYKKNGSIIKEKSFSFYGRLGSVFFSRDSYIIQYNKISQNFEYDKSIGVFGENLQQKKILIQQKITKPVITNVQMMRPWFAFKGNKDKIFMINSFKGLVMTIFTSDGIKLNEFDIKYEKIPIDAKFKEDYLKQFLSTYSKDQIKQIKKKLKFTFSEYYPPLIDFFVNQERIFFKTYEKKGDFDKYFVLSVDGRYMKNIFLPESKLGLECFYNSKYFYLAENEDKEIWELHSVQI